MLSGKRLSFDEESRALYDAVTPAHTEEYFLGLQRELEKELPGEGPLIERYEAFRNWSSSRATGSTPSSRRRSRPAASGRCGRSSCPRARASPWST